MEVGLFGMIAVFVVGYVAALLSLAGVALGGYMVYATKRESHENLFGRQPQADAGTAESEFDDDDLDWGTDVSRRNSEFLNKLKQDFEQGQTDVE